MTGLPSRVAAPHYRPGSERGSPNDGSTLSSKWVIAQIRSPLNSGPLCPWHNPFKSTGYHLRRDENGRWHTYRPDGTEVRPI